MVRTVILISVLVSALAPAGQEKRPTIRNMAGVNTAASENDPCLSPDGQQLLYSSDKTGKYELYLANRKSAGQPLAPERFVDELATEGEVRTPYLLPRDKDGWEYLFFATQFNTDSKKKNYDIYRVGRFDPKRPFQGNNAASAVQLIASEADEAHPWLSADARELYFSRKTEQGWKLMLATGKVPRVFEKVEDVPVSAGFHHACLNKAGTKMIIQGPILQGQERQGLFICKRMDKNESWGDPIPLQSLNTSEGTTCSPMLSFDAKFLYFASDRPGGKGGLDLYVVAVGEVEELK